MRDQRNPSTPELHQPLLFAPSELLACGLRDAHHHPLVGVRTEDGVRSWRTSPATAWEHPLVEWARTATSYCSIVLDCDSRESQELACAVEAGYGDLPRPNVAAQRASSGHLHLGWNLRTPVHRGAASRPRPLAALGRIAEYYAVTLRSDRGYVGVLAYNPVHGDYNTVYPRSEPYDLAELARALPAHWRRPARAADPVQHPNLAMVLRWVAAGVLEATKGFRRIKGCKDRRSSRHATAVLNAVILRGRVVGFPLIATDGFEYDVGVIERLFGSACVYGHVLKTRRNDRVGRVERRRRMWESEDSETLHTSFVERLNLTIRQGSASVRRRSPCHARGADQLHGHVDLLRCSYHVIRPHRALQCGRETRTPAMQAGLVNAPMNWSDIFTAPAALYAFHVAVVRVPGAVQLMHTSPAALSSFSWPHEHRSAA